MIKAILTLLSFLAAMASVQALGFVNPFAPKMLARAAKNQRSPTKLGMGWFDFNPVHGGGSGKEALDEQWEAQQEILRARRQGGITKEAMHKKYEHGGPSTFQVKARDIQAKEAQHRAFQEHTFLEDATSQVQKAAKKNKKKSSPKIKFPW
mmetsp:Transcript_12748/g.27981  ORF Transcript_12748/g.27981 Transcript_12748/m.27981 type:complete len:151 (+) Transcript_12748:63-515(+)|eukprot:CAMPEP_0168737090 /NCGR_PEP_ID=MMETSP0724-20121128/10205_1 /TAXON_ID=265536 /ORGANISM="Amphiprora sp., Strain CCMP467" /LENGTH=150 /DNA_ID=CAMNT_0008784325 /DNA_START=66 /DNA_END=518 /DNA_ORIENTATION=+